MNNIYSVFNKAGAICFLTAIGLSAALVSLILAVYGFGLKPYDHGTLMIAALFAGGAIGWVLRR